MKFVIVILSCVMLAACGKAKPKDVPQEKTGAIGPYDLVLSGENESRANAFTASINQEEGKVDFYLPNGDTAQYLVLHSFSAQVAGCNANGVQAVPVWYSSESLAQGELVESGMTLMTSPRTRSLLRMVFRGMKGCTQLTFSMVVRKLNVGVPQPLVDPQLAGTWVMGTAPGHTISLGAGSSTLSWIETRNNAYTCHRTLYPSTSMEAMGGWIVTSGAGMICKYTFLNPAKTEMDLNCYGVNSFGCSVPKNSRFRR